jgi:bla regulator protein BlaR1
MATELIDLLARLVLASSAAIVLALLIRLPLRRVAGAGAAYLCWLCVPLAMLAAAVPALPPVPAVIVAIAPALSASGMVAEATPDGSNALATLAGLWLCGAIAAALLLMAGQRAFVRSLGQLALRDGIWFAEHSSQGPVLLGLVKPIVVVPADFAARYSADEQALILAHERQHARRRDPLANAVLALLQCAFWFNPLMHLAAKRFRFDQELACDADVLSVHAARRQAYASAMLKTQVTGSFAMATCHWQASHPLKERIMQLKHTSTSSHRRIGHLIVALAACGAMLGTAAARAGVDAGTAEDYDIVVQFSEGQSAKVGVVAGEDFALNWRQPGQGWTGTFNVTPAGGSVMVKMNLKLESGKVITPSMLLKPGVQGRVLDGDMSKPAFQVGLTVTRKGA